MRALIFLLAAICIPCFSSLSFAAEHNHGSDAVTYTPDVTFTLRTDIADGKLVFVGETGFPVQQDQPGSDTEGAVVQINLINGDGAVHDVVIEIAARSPGDSPAKGASSTMCSAQP